ncbi:GNAT family N-acetyltransferase [Terrisporobacter glycolicus]|uniref:N-acetyltransferase domain-containing protein n=1 Tax=Terrisporobacter glycolicus ATCC 14880 = DSM 1288 TaxID=1121315 RepID=A0ABZ2ET37_9FIRM|nr:N-acetyltransferase [Terrisporobacter glycolicus]
MSLVLRNINTNDYKEVEILTREAFWNIYRPGCCEHLVIHNMHKDKKSIEELELVAVYDNKIVGHIAYTKGRIKGIDNETFITLGPISVMPEFQGKGIGGKLILDTLEKATKLGYSAVFITGDKNYYSRFGFESASKYGVYMEGIPMDDEAPFFMVKIFKKDSLKNVSGFYVFDDCYNVNEEAVNEFDKKFEY